GSQVKLLAIGISTVPIVLGSLGFRPLTLTAAASGGSTRQISSAGTTSFGAATQGSDGYEFPEYRGQSDEGTNDGYNGFVADRSAGGPARLGAAGSGAARTKSNTQVVSSFDGLFHRQQRLANGGNQFSVEPPDQGLCAGNGDVMEAVNDVTRVYDASGNPLTGVEDLNTFFGYAPAIVRSTGTFGPFVTDPSCYFDSAVQR